MSYTRVWIHAVWSTKNREPLIEKEIRDKIFSHIKDNAIDKGIFLNCIGGYLEHVHCLLALRADQNIASALQTLKGESSFWINKNKLTMFKFGWQNEYFAVSVSESLFDKVRHYIINQEEHHKHKTYSEEYEQFIEKFGFEKE
jgi:putative transposase